MADADKRALELTLAIAGLDENTRQSACSTVSAVTEKVLPSIICMYGFTEGRGSATRSISSNLQVTGAAKMKGLILPAFCTASIAF